RSGPATRSPGHQPYLRPGSADRDTTLAWHRRTDALPAGTIGVVETPICRCGKDTRSVKKIPGLAGRVRVGAPDASLTPASGVVAVAELVGRLGVTTALNDAVGSVKQRDRGLSAGEFLVAVAQAQMCGALFWTGLEQRRADTAGEALSAVATPASTTAVELARRFGPAQ